MKELLTLNNFACGYRDGFRYPASVSHCPRLLYRIIAQRIGETTLFRGISGDLPKCRFLSVQGKELSSLTLRKHGDSRCSQFTERTHISVEEYVLMGRMPYRKPFQFFDKAEDIEIAHHYMQLTGIYHLRDKSMAELCGGEQQMASIASALCQVPSLLLLDEPTSHLDITHQVKFMN